MAQLMYHLGFNVAFQYQLHNIQCILLFVFLYSESQIETLIKTHYIQTQVVLVEWLMSFVEQIDLFVMKLLNDDIRKLIFSRKF